MAATIIDPTLSDAQPTAIPLPYLSRLEGNGLEPGQTVVIKGIETGDHFNVSFLTGANFESSDIPFHISVRLKDKVAILNDRKASKWGKEEKKKEPFKEGEKVDLRVRAHENKFEVYANGKLMGEFEYRQPLNSINHLYIDGTVELHSVNWGGKYYPVPYQAGVEGGFATGKRLTVSGIPEKKAESFSINLINAANEIAFHFNPRFNKKLIVRNSQLGGTWGTEEIEGKFPLALDTLFDINIVNEPYALQVYINDQHFCAFAHRAEPNTIRGLKIEGDVELQGVHVK
uniref:Galectin n=1 Tax=Romanomermis culicivorax TaxID=13658 RepID=A0A915KCS8_ROMCU